MKRYTVKAYTIDNRWVDYSTNDKSKALQCANNVICSRVYDNKPEGGGSPVLIHSRGQESDVGKEYLINNKPKAATFVEELLN